MYRGGTEGGTREVKTGFSPNLLPKLAWLDENNDLSHRLTNIRRHNISLANLFLLMSLVVIEGLRLLDCYKPPSRLIAGTIDSMSPHRLGTSNQAPWSFG